MDRFFFFGFSMEEYFHSILPESTQHHQVTKTHEQPSHFTYTHGKLMASYSNAVSGAVRRACVCVCIALAHFNDGEEQKVVSFTKRRAP